MDIYAFLRQFVAGDIPSVLVVAGLVGGAAFFIVQGLDSIAKNGGGVGLAPSIKYWVAVALCLLIPFGAWVAVNVNDKTPLSFGGVLLAFGVAFIAATSIHWVTGGANTANALHEASIHPATPVQIANSDVKVTVHK